MGKGGMLTGGTLTAVSKPVRPPLTVRYTKYVTNERGGGEGEREEPLTGRIAAWIARQVEMGLVDSDLSLPQYRVLGLLAEGNALPSSMADRLDVRRPSITAVVDGLVARALVVRTPAEDDRRQVTHGITSEGRRVLRAADQAVNERLASIAGCLDSATEADQCLENIALWGKALVSWRNRARAVSPASGSTPAVVGAPAVVRAPVRAAGVVQARASEAAEASVLGPPASPEPATERQRAKAAIR